MTPLKCSSREDTDVMPPRGPRPASELSVLAEQQESLRRVATLVAHGATTPEVFAAVATELARCAGVNHASLCRYEPDGTIVVVAVHNDPGVTKLPVGGRYSVEGQSSASMVWRTGRPARVHDSQTAPGPTAARMRELGLRSGVGAPIIVDGHLWGVAGVGSGRPEAMPAETEARVADFAELVATAIANAAARDELRQLAEQQAALRRVATLVARGVSPPELFSAVADEMARCLQVELAAVVRYEADGTLTRLASNETWSQQLRVSAPVTAEAQHLAATVLRTGSPARIDTFDDAVQDAVQATDGARLRELGIRWVVGAPIIVDGRMWGMAGVADFKPDPPPSNTEERLGDFAELAATAIANAAARDHLQESRDRLSLLAEQQAALRRVATLVARGVSPSEVFVAVADEAARCLNAENVSVSRFEGEELAVLALARIDPEMTNPIVGGERFSLEGDNIATR